MKRKYLFVVISTDIKQTLTVENVQNLKDFELIRRRRKMFWTK